MYEKEIPSRILEKEDELTLGVVNILPGAFSSGFECDDFDLVVISASEVFEVKPKKRKTNSTFKEGEKIVFADLKESDFIVHKTHGIGQYIGVNTITADGVTKDYIKIKYKGDDILYVPTDSLDNVRKYIGPEITNLSLNKLGSNEWKKAKERVKKNLREVAEELIELYAKRQKMQGFAFAKDTPWQKEFEESFEFTETEDQLRCIQEVRSKSVV